MKVRKELNLSFTNTGLKSSSKYPSGNVKRHWVLGFKDKVGG